MELVDYIFRKLLKEDEGLQAKSYSKVLNLETKLMEKLPNKLKDDFDNYLKMLSKYELEAAEFIIKFTLDAFLNIIKEKALTKKR